MELVYINKKVNNKNILFNVFNIKHLMVVIDTCEHFEYLVNNIETINISTYQSIQKINFKEYLKHNVVEIEYLGNCNRYKIHFHNSLIGYENNENNENTIKFILKEGDCQEKLEFYYTTDFLGYESCHEPEYIIRSFNIINSNKHFRNVKKFIFPFNPENKILLLNNDNYLIKKFFRVDNTGKNYFIDIEFTKNVTETNVCYVSQFKNFESISHLDIYNYDDIEDFYNKNYLNNNKVLCIMLLSIFLLILL